MPIVGLLTFPKPALRLENVPSLTAVISIQLKRKKTNFLEKFNFHTNQKGFVFRKKNVHIKLRSIH